MKREKRGVAYEDAKFVKNEQSGYGANQQDHSRSLSERFTWSTGRSNHHDMAIGEK